MVLIDLHILWDDYEFILTNANVYRVENYYQKNPRTGGKFGWWGSNPYNGSPVRKKYTSGCDMGIRVSNYNLTGKKFNGGLVTHLNIVNYYILNN